MKSEDKDGGQWRPKTMNDEYIKQFLYHIPNLIAHFSNGLYR
jgi:hypothetical protein